MTNKFTAFALAVIMAGAVSATAQHTPERTTGWGDFKLYIDPGHEGRSNIGIWSYSEAEKVLAVGLNIKDMLETYTDIAPENLKFCRLTQEDTKGLQERSDEANAWGADFYYSIHSDAGNAPNEIVLLFGGWKKDGQLVEKTPNGGKLFGEFLEFNLSGVMRVGSRGNRYDRDFYISGVDTHENQYPYLSVNRESNMPSLLSEGGYHTQAIQQRRNMNAEYKRLEAFAAFQALLQYRGLKLPQQTFLHGMITNSENGQPINGATVTVDGKTYVTDTYESLFSKYTRNPNLIQNGLFTFENLVPGKTYEVKIEAPGFETVTKTVTIKEGGEHTPDFVTFCDVELTNTAPAKVDAISIENTANVSPIEPMVITFSRNMDRKSVEDAFSVDNDGQVALTWINDYQLSVDLSKLEPLWDYTFKIDGSIARNTQTNQLFDGDGDGQPGGDWTVTLTMAEPDTQAPQVVATYPAADGEAVYTHCPPIRVEYDEEIAWNDDQFGETPVITVTDKDGNAIAGKTVHAVIAGKSVLHFIANADLPADKCLLVKVEGGLCDRSGNATAPFYFRFLTEYRPQTEVQTIVPCTGLDSFWAPGGSGSSSGLDKDNSTTTVIGVAPNYKSTSSTAMNYVFDPGTTDGSWFIRLYNPTYTQNYSKDFTGRLTVWVYGDGSNNAMNMMVRIPNSSGGLKYKTEALTVDFRGWNLYTWELMKDEYSHFTGDQIMGEKGNWRYDSFTLKHEDTDPDDEEVPFQAWSGTIGFNSLEYSKWDETATRTASLTDVKLPSDGIDGIVVDGIDENAPVQYYDLNGRALNGKPSVPGLYLRRQGTTTQKTVIR